MDSNEGKKSVKIPEDVHRLAKMEAARLRLELSDIVVDGIKLKLAELKKVKVAA